MSTIDAPSQPLATMITADNAAELLVGIACPYCDSNGTLATFREPNNNGIGIVCESCSKRHPLPGIMWLRQGAEKQKRANDIAAVIKKCGNYCYICGTDFDTLRQLGIGRHVHHTRPFAEYGEEYRKIPTCALCHEVASALQRQIPRLLAAGSTCEALADRIQQELLRAHPTWFSSDKGKAALDQIMQDVKRALEDQT